MKISLNGSDWLFKGFYGEDWRWRGSHLPEGRDRRGWLPGRVPGSVHHDLWQSGEIPDPYFERNSLLAEWVPARTWLYKKRFTVDEALKGQRLRLCFRGVDYAAQFFLNGELLGAHTGMFTPAVFEVDGKLRYGEENLLAVVIEPAPAEQSQVGRTSRVRTHKSRMSYWWDFCPRMVHLGLWDEVYLEATGLARIEGVWVRPVLSPDMHHAKVRVAADLSMAWPAHPPAGLPAASDPASRNFKAYPVEVEVRIDLRCEGRPVASQQTTCDISYSGGRLSAALEVDEPSLWWPNGAGEPALYEADVQVMSPHIPGWSGQAESDRRSIPFGIRRIELVPNETGDSSASPYTFQVNGRKLYIKGWNWVPMDVMYGVERPEKLERLLVLARRAGANLLRVWGGGLIEKEAFYDLCDRLGILVWQEFIQSSSGIENIPPEDPETIEMMVREAEAIVPGRRNHPCLAVWCGGNELQAGPEQPAGDDHPLLGALKQAVGRLDPDRAWLPSSPSGRVFGNSLENINRDPSGLHDVHGPWEHQGITGQYTLYNRGTSLFHSEFGAEGITNRRTLDAVMAREHQRPVSLDNPLWQHLGAWWVKESAWRELFGEVETDEAVDEVDRLARATQFSQAEGLRYAVEADRRRKFQNSGTLPWQFNEPYPMAACTSAVDYYAQPKPAYHAVAAAYEPVHLSASFESMAWGERGVFEAQVWASNSELRAISGRLEMALTGASGRTYARQRQEAAFGPNASTKLAELSWPLDELDEPVFFLDLRLLRDGHPGPENRYTFVRAGNLSPLLHLPQTTLQTGRVTKGDTWEITLANRGDQTALFVWLEDGRPLGSPGYPFFSRNYFCLFPQESRRVQVDWDDVPAADRRLSVKGWNTEAYWVAEEEDGTRI